MKSLFVILLVAVVLLGCSQPRPDTKPVANFGEPVTLNVGQNVTFSDGLNVQLIRAEINCPRFAEARAPVIDVLLELKKDEKTIGQATLSDIDSRGPITVVGSYVTRLEYLEPFCTDPAGGTTITSNVTLTIHLADEKVLIQQYINEKYGKYCDQDSDCILLPELMSHCSHYCEVNECSTQTEVCKAYYRFSAGNKELENAICKASQPCVKPDRVYCLKNRCVVSVSESDKIRQTVETVEKSSPTPELADAPIAATMVQGDQVEACGYRIQLTELIGKLGSRSDWMHQFEIKQFDGQTIDTLTSWGNQEHKLQSKKAQNVLIIVKNIQETPRLQAQVIFDCNR